MESFPTRSHCLEWPFTIWDKLFTGNLRRHFQYNAIVSKGQLWSTEFSGGDFPRYAITGMQRGYDEAFETAYSTKIMFASACVMSSHALFGAANDLVNDFYDPLSLTK